MSVGIKASMNKFAFLHVEDSSEESDSAEQPTKGNPKAPKEPNPPNTSANAKKKARRRRKKNSSTSSDTTPGATRADNQMQDWVQHDRNLVDSLYHDDLKKACELSKVEFEKSQTERDYYIRVDIPRQNTHGQEDVDDELLESKGAAPSKKERKKNKIMKTISLEQFHQHVENSLPLQEEEPQMSESTSQTRVATEDTSHFFDEVEKTVNYIKRNDQPIQRLNAGDEKEAKLKPEKTNKRDRRQQAEEEKDLIVEKLRTEVSEWEQQFKHVKKRNKQLLVMLQQGEMKDKSELLLEIERLSILRDELTQEVTTMNESLEQERSRSSKLKDEVLKLQAKKSHEEN